MQRVDSLEKTVMLGGIGGRRRGQQRMRWLDGITDLMDVESEWTPGVGDGQGGLACCSSWGRKESDMTEQLNRTELMGLLWWLSVKESTCQCRRLGFDPWVRKIPWRRKWQPTWVFLSENSDEHIVWLVCCWEHWFGQMEWKSLRITHFFIGSTWHHLEWQTLFP